LFAYALAGILFSPAMHRLLKAMSALIGIFLLCSRPSAAEAHAKGTVVYLNAVPVLDIRVSKSSEVAAVIAKRLRTVEDDAVVKTIQNPLGVTIRVGEATVLLVSAEEAQRHGVGLNALAEKWSSNIRDALALPVLKFSDEYLKLPLNSAKRISLVGSLASTATVNSSDDTVVKVKPSDDGYELKCVGIGDALIRATSGNAARTLAISIRPVAGVFPQAFVAELTGNPAFGSTVSGMVAACIKTRVICIPGTTCSFIPVQADALGKGQSRTFDVRVRLRAKEAFDSVGNVQITVKNISVPTLEDTELWYSNVPESVHTVGSLFSSFLKPNAPIRLLYHHVNASTLPLILRVEAVNDSEETARVLITPGDSKPDKNPVRAGMTAAHQFLSYLSTQGGEILALPPHTTVPISVRLLSPKETMSGLCDLRLLSGPPEVQIRTDALPAFELVGSWYDASLSSTPWRETGTHAINDYDRSSYEPSLHIYPNPNKSEQMDYTVGGRSGFLLLGEKPISGTDHTTNLDGNFGVIYRIKAIIKNPMPQSADIDLVFEASAGYMGGIFLVDGKMVQTPLLSPKGEARLGRYHLPVGGSRTIDIITLPVSGGSYPATLFLRPAEQATGKGPF
jgi:hypothetical protein